MLFEQVEASGEERHLGTGFLAIFFLQCQPVVGIVYFTTSKPEVKFRLKDREGPMISRDRVRVVSSQGPEGIYEVAKVLAHLSRDR